MKEATLTSAHVAESYQSIDWARVLKTATRKTGRAVLTLIRYEYTPLVLAAIPTALMWWGFMSDNSSLYKWSAVAVLLPALWTLIRVSTTKHDKNE